MLFWTTFEFDYTRNFLTTVAVLKHYLNSASLKAFFLLEIINQLQTVYSSVYLKEKFVLWFSRAAGIVAAKPVRHAVDVTLLVIVAPSASTKIGRDIIESVGKACTAKLSQHPYQPVGLQQPPSM